MDNPNQPIFRNDRQESLPNATAVLVLGIISIVTCICYGVPGIACGIIALVLANKDTGRYLAEHGRYTEASYKNLRAGKICGIIGLLLSVLFLLMIVLFIVMMPEKFMQMSQYYKQY